MTFVSTVDGLSPENYWRLGESSGSTAYDRGVGTTRDMTYQNTPTLGAATLVVGDSDTAVSFNGTDEYVYHVVSNFLSGNTAGSIIALIKTTASSNQTIFSSHDNSSGSNVLKFYITSSGAIAINVDGTVNSAGSGYNDGNAHLFVVTSDGSKYRLYVDGAEVSTSGGVGNGDWFAAVWSADHITIGAKYTASTASEYFNGTLDEIAVFSSALSQANITSIWEATGILSADGDYYWSFDQYLTADAYITSAGSTFVESGPAVSYPSLGSGQAGDGGSNVQIGAATTLTATISPTSNFIGDMTVSFWVRFGSDAGSDDIELIRVSGIKVSSSETENALMVLARSSAGALTYHHEYGSGNQESDAMSGSIAATSWNHVMLIRDDTAKTVKLYIDGTLADTFTYTNSCTNTGSGATVTLGGDGYALDYDNLKIWGGAVGSDIITDESTPDSPTQVIITGNVDTVAYWLMTEAYTATVTDQVGSYDGTWSGIDATEDQATDILGDGNAVITLSSGFGGFTASTPIATPESSDYTFTVFVKFTSLTNAVLMEINGGTTNNTVLEVTSGGVIQLTRNSTTVATASSTVTTGTLYLIAVTEGSTNTTIYVNGVQEKQATKPTGTGTCTTVEVGSIDSGTHSYSMGHAAFFDQELTVSDIIDIYTSAPDTPTDVVDLGLVSYWKFDESSGTTLTDSFGSNDLTISGTYTLSETSVSTWGTTSAITFTDAGATDSSSELIDFGTGDFSFFVWIKPTGIGDGEREHIFSSVGNASAQTVNDTLTLTQLTAEPTTGNGVIAYADGTTWNPGSGEGVYAYYNSTWNKLG